MRVLIGCERSGVVRDAFRALGHDAYSCDIIKHSVDTYVESIEKLKAIEDLELAEDERELYEMNHKAMENLK